MNEYTIRYRKLGIMVLSKLLDDICPTFQGEEENEKALKIRDRIAFFKASEKDIDREWKQLEAEATADVKLFKKERKQLFDKIIKTNNYSRVVSKVAKFEEKKQSRIDYLIRKMDREILNVKSKTWSQDSEKNTNTQEIKAGAIKSAYSFKIKQTELRYNTIIKNTMNSDNSARVKKRLEQSIAVWDRKYQELVERHNIKTEIHNNKCREFDQIRIAIDGLVHEYDKIKHWCTVADVSPKVCYEEAIRRAKLVKRDTTKLEKVLSDIIAGNI